MGTILTPRSIGWYSEYMEVPDQRSTEVHQDCYYEYHFVRYIMPHSLFSPTDALRSSIIMVVGPLINMAYLNRMNKIKKEKRAEILAPYITAEHPDGGSRAWAELGDKHPDFKYQL